MGPLSEDLLQLMHMVSKFPGCGPRSAKRIALHLLRHKDSLMDSFISSLQKVKDTLGPCEICGYLDQCTPCFFCNARDRDASTICVVESTGDVWSIEKSGFFKGTYHVLGGLLSAFDGTSPQDLLIDALLKRVNESVIEIIFALSSNIDGQSTMYYISDKIKKKSGTITLSSLAKGMPIGSDLDYLDQGTLISAFSGRRSVE